MHLREPRAEATLVTAEAPRAALAPVESTGPIRSVAPERVTLARSKEDAELVRINEALAKHANNRQRAAAELGISRMTLYNKMHRYGLMAATA